MKRSRFRSIATRSGRAGRLIRRFGFAGILFFTVKGLLWILVPYAVWALRG